MAKRKKSLLHRIALIVIPLALMAGVSYFVSRLYHKTTFVHYREFGIDLPNQYPMHGIDISKHQQTVSWEDIREMRSGHVRIGFAFMKATEGLGRIDEQFRRNWLQSKRAGIPRGAYHFFIASKSGKAQAENFMETVQLLPGDLPPVLDVEQAYGTDQVTLQQRVADWLLMVEKKYGTRPMIYTNADFYENYLAGRFDDYPLWVAHYYARDKPRVNRDWTFWQHSESGHVNGIKPLVDFNVFNGDSAAFRKLLVR